MGSLSGKHVVVAGGSGFLGTSLTHFLADRGATVTVLSRSRPPQDAPCEHVCWDGHSDGDWMTVLDGCDALVNLAGRTVDCIKTPDHRDEILRSRVESTIALGRACAKANRPPGVWVQRSTAHIYGDPPTARCTESSPEGLGLAPDVARAWEAAHRQALLPAQRSVVVRTSFVIGRDRGAGGGAFSRLKLLAQIGLGGRVGRGTQGFSWIHEVDMNCIFERAIVDAEMRGCFIASSPQPVTQSKFMQELRRRVRMPIGLPSTEWMVRMGAPLVFRTDPELALYGRFVLPERLQDAGFSFRFPGISDAIADLL
ncbi:MAG: TIGR01777 family oxidoreductase [Aureliella sp.]